MFAWDLSASGSRFDAITHAGYPHDAHAGLWISFNMEVWLSSVTEGRPKTKNAEYQFFGTLDTALLNQGADRANELAQKAVDRARRVMDAVEAWRVDRGLTAMPTSVQVMSDPAVHMKPNAFSVLA